MTDRQIKAVAEAIENELRLSRLDAIDNQELTEPATVSLAKVAIAASDARFVPMLVEALKYYQHLEPEGFMAKQALSQLPEEYK